MVEKSSWEESSENIENLKVTQKNPKNTLIVHPSINRNKKGVLKLSVDVQNSRQVLGKKDEQWTRRKLPLLCFLCSQGVLL